MVDDGVCVFTFTGSLQLAANTKEVNRVPLQRTLPRLALSAAESDTSPSIQLPTSRQLLNRPQDHRSSSSDATCSDSWIATHKGSKMKLNLGEELEFEVVEQRIRTIHIL